MGPNPQETADLITFTEKILNEKLRYLCSEKIISREFTEGVFQLFLAFLFSDR